MRNLLLGSFFTILFSLICTMNIVAENVTNENNGVDVTMISYGTVTFQISGKAGTYYFAYPDQKTVTVDGLSPIVVPLNVTATAGLSGAVVLFTVKANNSSASQISVFSKDYKEMIDLDASRSANVIFLVPLSNGTTGTASVQMGLQ